MFPFQITFLDFGESDAIWLAVQKRIEKLEQFFERIVRVEVGVSAPHRHRRFNRLYHIQIHIFLPGEDVVINRKPVNNEAHRDIYVAIRDSFNAAERLLRERRRSIQSRSKVHQISTHLPEGQHVGKISKLFYQDGYGFLQTNDGREFYFDRRSLLNKKWDRLEVGEKVRFLEERGEEGPQASSMTAL